MNETPATDDLQATIDGLRAECQAANQRADALRSQLTAAENRIAQYVEEHRTVRRETTRIRAELAWLLQDAGSLRNRFDTLVSRAEKLKADNMLNRTANEAAVESLAAGELAAG